MTGWRWATREKIKATFWFFLLIIIIADSAKDTTRVSADYCFLGLLVSMDLCFCKLEKRKFSGIVWDHNAVCDLCGRNFFESLGMHLIEQSMLGIVDHIWVDHLKEIEQIMLG